MSHDRIEAVLKACAQRWPSVPLVEGTVSGLLRAGGRVVGVRARVGDQARAFRAPLVVGCDGAMSLVRRELGIATDRYLYDHYFVYIQAGGPPTRRQRSTSAWARPA